MARKVIVFDCSAGVVRVYDDVSQAVSNLTGRVPFIIVEGDVVASGTLEPASYQPKGTERASSAQPGGAVGQVVVVLDQMFRGYFADVIEREVENAEIHEIVGRGVQGTVRAGPRRYLEPAADDFDVLKVIERLARTGATVYFFTGDKRLASQAQVATSGQTNVSVLYLPPSEFPGKESLAQAMIAAIRGEAKG